MSWDIGKLVGDIAPAIVGIGGTLILKDVEYKNAKSKAEAQQEALKAEFAIAQQNALNIQAMQQAGKVKPEEEKSNLPLYIGLGVGGVVVIGLIIYLATRNKS